MSDLPAEIGERAETLTRRAREAVDPNEREAYLEERDRLLAEYGYTARVRSEADREVLVCYPDEWMDGDTVAIDRIEDTSRAVERQLSGTGDPDDFEALETHNRTIAERIESEHGAAHGANAHAFADFMSNHYAKRIEDATAREFEEFQTEYFPRNAWPTEKQREVLERSVQLLSEVGRDRYENQR